MRSHKTLSIALITALAVAQLNPQRVNAQAAAVIVPIGAVVVILGGIAYYTWTNTLGEEMRVPVSSYPVLEDPEEEMERMNNNSQAGRVVRADNATQAHTACSRWADGRGVATPEDLGNGRWRCRYY
jgi:hypothetical protein